MNGMEYDQYHRPGLLFKNKLALIHVVLHSFVIVTSPTSNDGLSVNQEQARGKQRWALQQPPYCELTTWSMIKVDLLDRGACLDCLYHSLPTPSMRTSNAAQP
jgi:hypothetical protein